MTTKNAKTCRNTGKPIPASGICDDHECGSPCVPEPNITIPATFLHAIKVAARDGGRYAMDHVRLESQKSGDGSWRESLATATDGKRAIVLRAWGNEETDADGSRLINRDTVKALKTTRAAPPVSVNGAVIQGQVTAELPDQDIGEFPPIADVMRGNDSNDIVIGLDMVLLRDTLDTLIKALAVNTRDTSGVHGRCTISFPAPMDRDSGQVFTALRIDAANGSGLDATVLLMPVKMDRPRGGAGDAVR